MGARAITIMIGSILGAIAYYVVRVILNDLCSNTTAWSTIEVKIKVLPRNLAKCWKIVKRFVLFNSKNQNDAPIENQQGRFNTPSETVNQTSIRMKIQSELMRKYERLIEIVNPSFYKLSNKSISMNTLLYHFPRSSDYINNPVGV